MKSLLVLGGNGFLGKAICRAGLEKGWKVSSLSRSGAPAPIPEDLLSVDWKRGSALDEDTLMRSLERSNPDYVVHTIGTLFESGPNQTYENLNYGTMKALLQTAQCFHSDILPIAYISANSFGSMVKTFIPKYMETKNKSEELLESATNNDPMIRGLIFRPGILYGWDRPATLPASLGFRLMTLFTGGVFPAPLHVDTLARKVTDSLESQTQSFQVYEVTDINA
jgi:nucleoside-diphosphate-sugar epimerase